MHGLHRLAPLLLAAALVAGCADPAPEEPADGPPAAQSAMSIVGLVQDEAFMPVAGANVSLRLVGLATATDAAGGFRFDGLVPSAYLVDVTADGYQTATLTAEPSATLNASLGFVLARPPSLRPSTEVVHYEGIYQCAFEALIIPGSCDVLLEMAGQSAFEDTSVFQLGLRPNWRSIAIDVDFDLSATPGLEGLRLVVRGIDDAAAGGEYRQYGRFHGGEPFTAVLDVNGTYPDGSGPVPANLTALEMVVYPQGHAYHQVCQPPDDATCFLGVGAGTDVAFDLYVTVFYNQPAPEGYTLLAS